MANMHPRFATVHHSRRGLLKLAGLGVLAAGTPELIAARERILAQGPIVMREESARHPAKAAADFGASIGVNIHASYDDTAYGNRSAWMSALLDGGFAHLRTGFTKAPDLMDAYEQLAGHGIKIMLVCDPREHSATAAAAALWENPDFARCIWGAEGPNEMDVNGGEAWATVARNYIAALSHLLRENPVTAHIRIVAPSLAQTNRTSVFRQLGDIGAYVDYANLHPCPGGCQPSDSLQDMIVSHAAMMAPGKPIVVSETGYSTQQPRGSDAPGGNGPMPPDMAAILIPRLYFENFRAGVAYTDLYELVDEREDGSWEDSLGLLHHDFSPKPAFTALRAITRLLKDPGEGSFVPDGLEFKLEGKTRETRMLLLQKRDHGFWLAVWEQVEVWDAHRQEAVLSGTATFPMNLVLSAKASGTVFVPNTHGTAPASVFTNSQRISFNASAAVTVISIGGTGVV